MNCLVWPDLMNWQYYQVISFCKVDYVIEVIYNDYNNVVVRCDIIIVVRGRRMKITTKIKDAFALGQVLQQSRMQLGISQRELAKLLGISQKWIWEMEQGKPGLLMERLFLILEKTEVTLLAEFDTKDVPKA